MIFYDSYFTYHLNLHTDLFDNYQYGWKFIQKKFNKFIKPQFTHFMYIHSQWTIKTNKSKTTTTTNSRSQSIEEFTHRDKCKLYYKVT